MAKTTKSGKRGSARKKSGLRGKRAAKSGKLKTSAKAKAPSRKPVPKAAAAKANALPRAPLARTPRRKALSRGHKSPLRRIGQHVLQAKTTRALGSSPYERDLDKTPANYQPLTPLSALERAASVFPDHIAIVHGGLRCSYAEFYARARRLASALAQHSVAKNDTVAALLPNIPEMLEAHYGVPMCGAVLLALNTRLDAAALAFMLDHGEAKLLIADREYSALVRETLARAKTKPHVIMVDDREYPQEADPFGDDEYESFLATGDAEFAWSPPADEWDAIALNYTSGTTGDPKGVVYHHRGAALIGYGNVLAANMARHPVYLWTLPMFHCNGWCFPWSLSVVAGTHVCLRKVRADAIYAAVAEHGVTHLSGAPIVMSTLLNAPQQEKRAFTQRVEFLTAAAPPPETVLAQMAEAGFQVTHIYGLTETYGPAVVNEWHTEWNDLPPPERGTRKARQGVRYHPLDGLSVMDPETMEPVPADGETLGEVMFRGNLVMKGYLKNPAATREAFAGGWFHSGDLGVLHPDGYIQLKDRSKDIIISGGENISSIEVENALMKHPAVLLAAVVARPDAKWGETPVAFVERRSGHEHVDEAALIAHCRAHLARYKAPSRVVFAEIPKTATGKLQKFKLREIAKSLD